MTQSVDVDKLRKLLMLAKGNPNHAEADAAIGRALALLNSPREVWKPSPFVTTAEEASELRRYAEERLRRYHAEQEARRPVRHVTWEKVDGGFWVAELQDVRGSLLTDDTGDVRVSLQGVDIDLCAPLVSG